MRKEDGGEESVKKKMEEQVDEDKEEEEEEVGDDDEEEGQEVGDPPFQFTTCDQISEQQRCYNQNKLEKCTFYQDTQRTKYEFAKSAHISNSQFNSQSYLQKMNFKKTNLPFCIKVFSNIWEEIQ